MNFFEYQDRARQNTLYLLFLFGAALLGMVVLIYISVVMAFFSTVVWQPEIFLIVLVGVLGLVGTGSLFKFFALRGGGSVVAQDLGGRLVSQDTTIAQEQQLLNVVEEMAIASGVAVPAVYLLDREAGINAFAAGFTAHDAVIGVTQGCLDQLSRDELQGVIAHEFSHILNGDMRLNLRLIAVLQGILLIHIIGRVIVRGSYGTGRRSRSNEKGSGGQIVLLGLALLVIGFIGLICGRLIKSAISRQREFLADASAVQFTRNPDGLSGALQKIGGLRAGSTIQAPAAEEASHLFFGEAMNGFFIQSFAWFGTHPPLEDRVGRLEKFAGRQFRAAKRQASGHSSSVAETPGVMGLASEGTTAQPSPSLAKSPNPKTFMGAIGTANAQNLQAVRTFLAQLPDALREATHESQGAIALVFALLLDEDAAICDRQRELLLQTCELALVERTWQLRSPLQQLDARARLPLVDLTIPALRAVPPQELKPFLQQVRGLVEADGKLSLSEYTLQVVLHRRLRPVLAKSQEPQIKYQNLQPILPDCITVLSALAQTGGSSPQDVVHAFRSGLFRLPGASKLELPQRPVKCRLSQVGKSLRRLELATPKLKQAIVAACAHTVLEDQQVTLREAELLRAVVISLDCPIPPFLDAATMGKG